MVEKYFVNAPEIIERKDYQKIFSYDSGNRKTLDPWYSLNPVYSQILEECKTIAEQPERHQIVQSKDINSCFRYISFNPSEKILFVTAHFRSQNNLTHKDDFAFICKCIINYMASSMLFNDFQIMIVIDEFLTIKETK